MSRLPTEARPAHDWTGRSVGLCYRIVQPGCRVEVHQAFEQRYLLSLQPEPYLVWNLLRRGRLSFFGYPKRNRISELEKEVLEYIRLACSVIYDRRMRKRLQGYRPVVICLIQATERDAFLFVRPAMKRDAWMAPQEGIEPDESVNDATVRGLSAELGISEDQLHFRRSVWLGCKKIPEQHGERDIDYSFVKMRGKAYYAALVKVSEATEVNRNAAEVAGHEWLDVEEIKKRLETNSERKQSLTRTMFAKLLKIEI